MSSNLSTYVPVLDGTNYQEWAAKMQSYLMSQGQWRCIQKAPPSEVKDEHDVVTNQSVIDDWDENISKAVGNIRLRLHHTIAYQYNAEEDAATLWAALNTKYGNPGVSRAFIEFKGAMDTAIPNNSDPQPALNKMQAHFTRLKDIGLEIPDSVQAMMYLAKAPQSMETMVQVFCQETDLKKITVEKILPTLMMSYQASQRQGVGRGQNQQRANRLSAVKRDNGPPQFQQQQQPQQQHGDGTWQQQPRKNNRRGKRGGVKNQQQQLNQAAIQAPAPPQLQGPQQPPPAQYQWVANPSATTSQLGYFAQSAAMTSPPPPPNTMYPTFNNALQLARKLDVCPSIKTLKTLECQGGPQLKAP